MRKENMGMAEEHIGKGNMGKGNMGIWMGMGKGNTGMRIGVGVTGWRWGWG
jgi:hypothetical protein